MPIFFPLPLYNLHFFFSAIMVPSFFFSRFSNAFSYHFFFFQPSWLFHPHTIFLVLFFSNLPFPTLVINLFSFQFLNSSASLFIVSFAFLLVTLSSSSSALYNFQIPYSPVSIISLSFSLLFCTAILITFNVLLLFLLPSSFSSSCLNFSFLPQFA